MHLAVALPLLLAAGPATLLASPVHQQQEHQAQQNQVMRQNQQQQQQQQQGNQPIIIGVDHRAKTSKSVDNHDSGKTMSKDKSEKSKRHHIKLDVFFGHVLHPDCADKEKRCKSCGDDLNCISDPDCEWCFACVWTTMPDVSYCNSSMSRV